jgi:hypothetical protein
MQIEKRETTINTNQHETADLVFVLFHVFRGPLCLGIFLKLIQKTDE